MFGHTAQPERLTPSADQAVIGEPIRVQVAEPSNGLISGPGPETTGYPAGFT